MKLTIQDTGYILQLYGYEVHNLKLTLNKCGMEYYNFLIDKRGSNNVPHIPKRFIDMHVLWSSEFKTRLSNCFYIDSRDVFHIAVALEYSAVVDKYHAQFICDFRNQLCKKLKEFE